MGKKIIFIILIMLLSTGIAQAFEKYYEVEKGVAYREVNDPYYSAPDNDIVWYYDERGCKRYTTRAFARRWGLGYGGYYNYPYWKYRRIHYRPYFYGGKYKKSSGLLTRILEILI